MGGNHQMYLLRWGNWRRPSRREENNRHKEVSTQDMIEQIKEDLDILKSIMIWKKIQPSALPRSPLYRAIDCPQCNCPCDCDSTTCNSTVHTAKQLNLISQKEYGNCGACCQGDMYREGEKTVKKPCHIFNVDFAFQVNRCMNHCLGI